MTTNAKNYKDPLQLQSIALDSISDKLNVDVTDPNCTAFTIIEQMGAVVSDATNRMLDVISQNYLVNTRDTEDLARHLSEFEYVGFYATPASTEFIMSFSANHLINKAVTYSDNYSKVIIPQHTTFEINGVTFGLYYPIEIRINKHTQTFSVSQDMSKVNPLVSMNDNLIEHHEQIVSGVKLLSIKIPVYQFKTEIQQFDTVQETGFSQLLDYTDQFYALRAYNITGAEREDIIVSLSNEVYDTSKTSIVVRVDTEKKQLKLDIPYVYFNSGKVGNKIEIEILTTKGKVGLDYTGIANLEIDCTYIHDEATQAYSTVLEAAPTTNIELVNTIITGGGNELDFDTKRNSVIYGSDGTDIITRMDLKNKLGLEGYGVQTYKDNITDRILYAYKTLITTDNKVVPSAELPIRLCAHTIDSCSTINRNMDGSITILPSTTFMYNSSTRSSEPLNDTDKLALLNLPKAQKVNQVNQTNYTYIPFHIRVNMDEKYPYASSYNLHKPQILSRRFIKENTDLTLQLVAFKSDIIFRKGVGYVLRLSVNKHESIKDIPYTAFKITIGFNTSVQGNKVYKDAVYKETFGNDYIYELVINTDFDIDIHDSIYINDVHTSYRAQPITTAINLVDDLSITYMVERSYVLDKHVQAHELPHGYDVDYAFLTKQEFKFQLGTKLDTHCFNKVDIIRSTVTYERYTEDVPLTYSKDVYAHDENGTPTYSIVDGKVVFNILHKQGEVVLDEQSHPVIQYPKDTLKLDSNGQPIPTSSRENIYLITAPQLDCKLFISEDENDKKQAQTMLDTYIANLDTLTPFSTALRESTRLFYKPKETLGTGKFTLGDDVLLELPLALDMHIKYHVKPFALADNKIIQNIKDITINEIDKALLTNTTSLTELFTNIQKTLVEYTDSVDVLGINGMGDLQTVKLEETDKQTYLGTKLFVDQDDMIKSQRTIQIDIVKSASS